MGQCGVTALVAQDYLGGDIVKTSHGYILHFHNIIDGNVIDFTDGQFGQPIDDHNDPSDRQEAFADTNAAQYACLKSIVEKRLQTDWRVD